MFQRLIELCSALFNYVILSVWLITTLAGFLIYDCCFYHSHRTLFRSMELRTQCSANQQACGLEPRGKKLTGSPGTSKFPATIWRWLPHRLSKRQSQTTVLLRTPITQMIFFNQGSFLKLVLVKLSRNIVPGSRGLRTNRKLIPEEKFYASRNENVLCNLENHD